MQGDIDLSPESEADRETKLDGDSGTSRDDGLNVPSVSNRESEQAPRVLTTKMLTSRCAILTWTSAATSTFTPLREPAQALIIPTTTSTWALAASRVSALADEFDAGVSKIESSYPWEYTHREALL